MKHAQNNLTSLEKENLCRLGQAICSRRQTLGLSQEELARRAGIYRTYLGEVEKGERNVTILTFYRLAQALNIKTCTLLEFKTKEETESADLRNL